MVFDPDLSSLLPHIVLESTFSSIDGYGAATFSTANSSYTARVSFKEKLVRAPDGTEKISTANAVLQTTATISPDNEYTLPDGTVRPILSISRMSDTGGQHHARIFFG